MASISKHLRPFTLFRTLTVLSVLLLLLLIPSYLYWSRSPRHATSTTLTPPANFTLDEPPDKHKWTKVVWQTSKLPAAKLTDEDLGRFNSWREMNPGYRQEVMTDGKMESYVRQKYAGTEMERVFFEVQDHILRSDLIRYLILLADGGVYNDLDVGCQKAIDSWVPKEFGEQAGVLLGVEVDNKFGPDGRTFEGGEDLFELVNWTMVAKPGQPFIDFLVKRVVENLRNMQKEQGIPLSKMTYNVQEVLTTTGPAALTMAFFDYASSLTGTDVTYKNFTKIIHPKLVGEVVILPIHAFGAGHQVEWAGFKQDQRKVLVHHYFKGSWKEDHAWGPLMKQKEVDTVPENEQEDRLSARDKAGRKEGEKVVRFQAEQALTMATEGPAAGNSNPDIKAAG